MRKAQGRLIYLSKPDRDSIYISAEHEVIMLTYYLEIDEAFAAIKPSKESFRMLSEIMGIIVDYSNSFSEEKEMYFSEWIRIIPTNLTYAVAGFISGLKNNNNAEICNLYYSEVLQTASRCLLALNTLEPDNE